jgi:hypothetical protein
MRVPAQVFDDLFGSEEWFFGIDDPLLREQLLCSVWVQQLLFP